MDHKSLYSVSFQLIIPKQNEFISLQCLGPFYSYDALTLMGLLGYRSYIVVPLI